MSDFSLGPLPFHDGSCRVAGAKYRGERQPRAPDDDDNDNDGDDDGSGGDGDDDVGDVGNDGDGDDDEDDGHNFFVQRQLRSQRIVTADTLSSKYASHVHGRAPRVQG